MCSQRFLFKVMAFDKVHDMILQKNTSILQCLGEPRTLNAKLSANDAPAKSAVVSCPAVAAPPCGCVQEVLGFQLECFSDICAFWGNPGQQTSIVY